VDVFGSVLVLVEDPDGWAAAQEHLRSAGCYPQPLVGSPSDVESHRRAWVAASARDAPTLVVASGVRLQTGWRTLLAAVATGASAPGWDVLHLDAARSGAAYVVTAEGAAALLAGSGGGAVDEVMAATSGLGISAFDPAPVVDGDVDAAGVAAGPSAGARPGDVERLLGYQGAIPFDDRLVEVGPDLYEMAFWTADYARLVIRAAEAVDAWGSDDLDPVPGDEVSLATISPRLFAHVEDHVAAIVVPTMRRHWPLLEFHGLRDAFVIRYTGGEEERLRLHHDVAQVSGSVRLSDDHEGGELVFPRQQVSNKGIDVGRLLLWPSLVTHPHAAEPVTRGVKYGLTLWLEVPGPAAP